MKAIFYSLGPIDAKSVGRDAMLRWMVVLPLVMALGMRWVLPLLVARLDPWLPLDLADAYPDLMGYLLLLLVPYLWGTVIGFLLLDQRDDGTLVALQVTPLSPNSYLAYRLSLPLLLSLLSTLPVFLLGGLVAIPPGPLFLLALAAAPQAPLAALAMASLAQNKVQGLALMKVANVVLLPPLVAYFLPAAWQWPFFLFPTYWPARMLWAWTAGAPHVWLYLPAGLAYQLLLIRWLARRFSHIMHR